MRKVMSFGLSVVLALSITGCGSGNNGGSQGNDGKTTPNSSAPSSTNSRETPKKEVSLKIGLPGAYEVTDKAIIDGFIASHPHIKVEIDESPWGDFVQKITAQVAGGNPPDVWLQENAVILGYGKRGVAEDLTAYMERDLKADEYSQQLFAAKTDTGIWGVPHGLNPIAMMYNKAMFDEANIPYPTDDWTYEDMLNIAKQLSKDTDNDGVNDVWGLNVPHAIANGWYPWSKIYGGGILDETKTKAMVTDPKTIQGLNAWVNTIKDGIAPSVDQEKAGGGAVALFADNRLALNPMQYSTTMRLNKEYPDFDFDGVQMPIGYDGKRVVPNVVNMWLIHSRSSQEAKDAAWEFLNYYLSDEAQNIIAKSGASIPVKISAADMLVNEGIGTKPENKAAYVTGVNESGQTTDENHSWQEWRTAAQPIFQEIKALTKSVEDGAAEIQKKIQEVLDENP